MVEFTYTADQLFRDYVTDGVPESGIHKPPKGEMRAWGTELEQAINGIYGDGTPGIFVQTEAGVWVARTIVGAGGVTVENGDGVAGNPTLTVTVPATSPQGRLTLTTGVPVQLAEATAATSIFYAPYLGNAVPIYDGAAWATHLFAELVLPLNSNSGHTGYHQSGKIFDLFVIDDDGTLRLVSGPAWTSDTARATAIGYNEGFMTNAASMTARFGTASGNTLTVAAGEGTYVGTFRASANGQTIWTPNPAAGAGGGDCRLFLWNMYHRVAVAAISRDTTNSWNYTTATWRAANAAVSSGVLNRVSVVVGVAEDVCEATYTAPTNAASGENSGAVAIGVDSTSVASGQFGLQASNASAMIATITGRFSGVPGIGLRFFQALESAPVASGTRTFYGDNGNATFYQMALQLRTRM